MNTERKEKRGIASIFRLCPKRHILCIVSASVILLHLITRGNKALMARISENIVRPLHRTLSVFWSCVPFSGAELLIGSAVSAALVYIIYSVIKLIRCPERGKRLYRMLVTFLAFGLTVYAGFCILWGVYYYGDDFISKSGLDRGEISVDELETVTRYFADMVNRYSYGVKRDDEGFYDADRDAILARSPEIFREAEKLFPCLAGPSIPAKGIHFSRVMSYLDFTGFFFPFTAEANVNTDFPPGEFAATVAHELSHQRGVAKEQEANFTAVLACLTSGDADYLYSGCMMAYTYLGNALYSADREAWEEIFLSLSDGAVNDIYLAGMYWTQFETPVQEVSNSVYEGFLQSYDQKLGLKSYGACVDLLVNYYYEEACS